MTALIGALILAQAPVKITAEQDHQQMLDQLHITNLRRGADGMDAKSPFYQNIDEAKANPYPDLPDPLVLNNGEKVTTAREWFRKRRPEIVEAFDREIYGRVPRHTPAVKWEVAKTEDEMNGDVPVVTKHLVGHVDNRKCPSIKVDIQLTLSTPKNATSPVPVMMEFGFGGNFKFPGQPQGPTWQQQVLAKGWGYAVIVPTSYQADNGGGLTQGIIGLCNGGQPRKPDDWGALRAWAWGASRALD
jgi:(4-O-methyl)-D-glucuronate---lignin esterase